MRAQLVADDLLPPVHGGFDPGAPVVSRRVLPRHAPVLGDVLEVAVPLRGCGLGRVARHGTCARRDDDGRVRMALGDAGVNAIPVVGAVAGERRHRARDLIEQGTGLRRVVHVLAGQRASHDPAGAGVHAQMQRPPRPACRRPVLLKQPLALAAQLQARAVHQQVHGLAASTGIGVPRPRHVQRRRTPAQRRVVRHAQAEAEQADNGAEQALGLPVGQAEHCAYRERRQDGERRIPSRSDPTE